MAFDVRKLRARQLYHWTAQLMRIDEGFRAVYRELEARMRGLAEADGEVFLLNPAPAGPVVWHILEIYFV